MKILLVLGLLMQSNVSGVPAPRPRKSYSQRLMEPASTARWNENAVRNCRKAALPTECVSADVAAKYSEAAMWACRDAASERFSGEHGGTSTTYAQHSIRETCRGSIQFCRDAWSNRDRIYFHLNKSATDPRRLANFEAFLTETCGAAPGLKAPF